MKKALMAGLAIVLMQGHAHANEDSFDVLGSIMDSTKVEINARQEVEKSKLGFKQNKHVTLNKEGYWQFFQASSAAGKGEYCAGLFIREGMGVALVGPGGSYKGALMLFFNMLDNPAFPSPATTQKIRVSLKQGAEAPVTTTALNYTLGGAQVPVVAFAVPTMQAALDGMEDQLAFQLHYQDKPLVEVAWHSALRAREEMGKCLAGKPFDKRLPAH